MSACGAASCNGFWGFRVQTACSMPGLRWQRANLPDRYARALFYKLAQGTAAVRTWVVHREQARPAVGSWVGCDDHLLAMRHGVVHQEGEGAQRSAHQASKAVMHQRQAVRTE